MSEHGYTAEPADTETIVGMLAQRRQDILEGEVFTWPIPRWNEPTVTVQFKLIPHTEIGRGLRSIERATGKLKSDEDLAKYELDVNTDLLIRASLDVIITNGTGDHHMGPISGGKVAQALGLPTETPTRIVAQQLFIADGDLMRCANSLANWSGYRPAAADEAIRGE